MVEGWGKITNPVTAMSFSSCLNMRITTFTTLMNLMLIFVGNIESDRSSLNLTEVFSAKIEWSQCATLLVDPENPGLRTVPSLSAAIPCSRSRIQSGFIRAIMHSDSIKNRIRQIFDQFGTRNFLAREGMGGRPSSCSYHRTTRMSLLFKNNNSSTR